MATAYYCLVGVLLLTALASGQKDVHAEEPEQLQVLDRMNRFGQEMILPMLSNPYLCKACEGLVGFLKNVTENQQLLDELVNLLLPLCDWVPYVEHDACLSYIKGIPAMVKQYADMYLDPTTDCAMVCASSRMRFDANNLVNLMHKKRPTN